MQLEFLQKHLLYLYADGTTGQFLKTDGSGNLAFATVNQFITLSDGTATDQYNTSETLLFTGGQELQLL
jgi:hypothetical protein